MTEKALHRGEETVAHQNAQQTGATPVRHNAHAAREATNLAATKWICQMNSGGSAGNQEFPPH